MELYKSQSKPQKVKQPNGTFQTIRVELTTHKIIKDKDMKKFHDEAAEGLDILSVIPAKDCSYVLTRKIKPVKIAM